MRAAGNAKRQSRVATFSMVNNVQQEKDTYFVAVKVFLVDDEGRLLIIKDIYDDGWDIPGGRLRKMDFDTPLEEVIKRKMEEELGKEVKYDLGEPITFMRHERDEVYPSGGKKRIRIFAVGYQARSLGGEVRPGYYLKDFKWVELKSFVPEDYLVGGWLKGAKEFQARFKKKLLKTS